MVLVDFYTPMREASELADFLERHCLYLSY